MGNWLKRLLFDWVFVLLYRLFQSFLNLVDFIESFFDIFAGTAKVFYQGNADFLINIFFGHDAVTNAFWAMALIAIVLAFGFCIFQMARKAADVAGAVRQSVGQIMSSFFRCLLIIVLINAITVAAVNITNVLLDRINYALENAAVLDQEEEDKTFTDQEYAAMAKILATVANYSVNPSADSRYNVNSCFNAIRPDLLSLYTSGFFQYDYALDQNGHYTWQGALALLASSADLTTELNLDTYYSDVATAIETVSREISTYPDFAPVQSAHFATPQAIDTDVLIFLIAGMEASQNEMYNTGDFNDAIRKGYISGEKDYNNLTQVRKDFDIWEMDYLVGYISCMVFIVIMAICIFTFIVRMFNLLLLYLTAPLFASSMPLDEGGKWQSWVQAFVIQLFSGFGMVIAMRLYLIIIPLVISSDLVFFAGDGVGIAVLNRMAQLLMVLGGAWAVLQSGSVITGILAGNPGMAAIQQEGRIGAMVTSWAMRAPRAALGTASSMTRGLVHLPQSVRDSQGAHLKQAGQRADLATRKAMVRQNSADAMFQKAEQQMASGASSAKVSRTMHRAQQLQRSADRAGETADRRSIQAGRRPPAKGYGRVRRGDPTDSAATGAASASAAAASVGASVQGGSAAAAFGGSSVRSSAARGSAARDSSLQGGPAASAQADAPIPSRNRSAYEGEARTGGGGHSSSAGEGGSAYYSNLVAGKRWTPPSLSGAEATGASHGASYGTSHSASHGASYGASHSASHGASYGASHSASHGASYGEPQSVPLSEQYVSAVLSTADAPRARSSAPADNASGSVPPPSAPSGHTVSAPSGRASAPSGHTASTPSGRASAAPPRTRRPAPPPSAPSGDTSSDSAIPPRRRGE